MRALEAALLMRRRRQRTRRDRRSVFARVRRAGLALVVLLSGALICAELAAGLVYVDARRDLPPVAQLTALLDPASSFYQPTRLYDRSGAELLLEVAPGGVARRYIPLESPGGERLPAELGRVAVAALDSGFYHHMGLTWAGLAGSQPTIAQRLVSEQILVGEAPGFRRSLRVAVLAWRATETLGRARILEAYLNSAAFGPDLFGVEAAAQAYFGTSAADLDLAEVVFLVSALQDPQADPRQSPSAARQAQSALLGRLLVDRAISPQEYLQARDQDLVFHPMSDSSSSQATAFTDLALEQLNEQFGAERVRRGGLTVRTTLDLSVQRQAECLLAGGQTGADGTCSPAGASPTSAADGALVLDPGSGQILALAGAAQARHPAGTLLSPFVYLAGFTQGLSPASLVWDVPIEGAAQLAESCAGPERLRVALVNDHAAPAWQALERAGADTLSSLLADFDLPGSASIAVGSKEPDFPLADTSLTLLDAARAYAVFANQGTQAGVAPQALQEVRDPLEQTLYSGEQAEAQPLVSPALAYLVNDVLMLEDTSSLSLGRQAAVKRALSIEGAWIVGYTPQRLAAVWTAQGGPSPAANAGAIWQALMQAASQGLPAESWPAPVDITRVSVCARSGLLPGTDCPEQVEEVFLAGREPLQSDDLYRSLPVNRQNGLLATVYTPPELVETREYLNAPAEYRDWAAAAGFASPPVAYDPIPTVQPLPEAHFDAPAALQVVSGRVTLRGTAAGDDFAYYRVQVGQGLYPTEWMQVGADVEKAVTSGTLATWDTAGLEGLYAVRLLVVDHAKQVRGAVLLVTVESE